MKQTNNSAPEAWWETVLAGIAMVAFLGLVFALLIMFNELQVVDQDRCINTGVRPQPEKYYDTVRQYVTSSQPLPENPYECKRQ